jgi:hypothetical protein
MTVAQWSEPGRLRALSWQLFFLVLLLLGAALYNRPPTTTGTAIIATLSKETRIQLSSTVAVELSTGTPVSLPPNTPILLPSGTSITFATGTLIALQTRAAATLAKSAIVTIPGGIDIVYEGSPVSAVAGTPGKSPSPLPTGGGTSTPPPTSSSRLSTLNTGDHVTLSNDTPVMAAAGTLLALHINPSDVWNVPHDFLHFRGSERSAQSRTAFFWR